MKAGFKPKLFTKKEWDDNASSAVQGCGVGEALAEWQTNCKAPVSGMTLVAIGKAAATAQKLMTALTKAEGKCGTFQKETKAGIGEYKKKVIEFQKVLKVANVALSKRKAMHFPMDSKTMYAKLTSDAELKRELMAWAEKWGNTFMIEAWLLWQKKSYTVAVQKYGPGNKYNIDDVNNKILLAAFVTKNLPKDKLKILPTVLGKVGGQFASMIAGGPGVSGAFQGSAEFKAWQAAKYPIPNFAL